MHRNRTWQIDPEELRTQRNRILPIEGGDGSTLTLDFTTGVLDPRLSFSRSTGGSYVHSDGLLYGFDTSSSSNTIGTGSKTFTISATAGVNRRYAVGDLIIASSGANNMSGSVTSYDPATQALVCNITGTPTGSGTFTTWIIGNRQPRFDYNPTTNAAKGLLIEGSASNVLQYSEAVDQSPWFTAGTVARATFTGGNGPNGVNNSGSKLSATSINSTSSLYYNGVSLTAQTYTMSVFAKADGANWIWINVQSTGTIHGAFFDLSGNGALGNTTGTVVSGSNIITKYPNGWFRIQFTFTGTAAFWYPVLLPCTSNGTGYASIAGQAPNGVLVYGCMFETGSGASSYIPTGASQATRNQDVCYMDTAQVNSWFIKNNEATFQVRYSCDNALSASMNIFYLGQWGTEYSYGYQHYTYAGSGGTLSGNGKLVSATSADNGIYANQSLPRVFNTAFSFSTSASLVANSWNGNTPSQLSATSWPTWTSTTIRLGIGTRAESGTSSSAGFMRIQSLKYWPTRLTNAQLQSLTT